MDCKFCNRKVKANEIVRTATHDLGCVHCYAAPVSLTLPVKADENGRPREGGS